MTFRVKQKKSFRLIDVFTVYIIIFLLWTGYRISLRLPEWFDEFVAKPILWITPLMFFQKKLLTQTVKSLKIKMSYSILFGLSIGILYFFVYTLFSSSQNSLSTQGILLQMIVALSTGFIEELVFRSYFLERALLIFNDRISANAFTTALFTLIHFPIIVFIYKYPLAETLSYLSLLTISGFIYGLVYLHKKSLLASTMTHAVWNFLGTILR